MPPDNATQSAEERRQLVERAASSRHLARSERLRSLLRYLTEKAVEDEHAAIHEQEVGRDVFGRSPGYDPASDNIVRVHVSTLRKRLEQYFAGEGSAEPLVIEIPKGNYAPVFRPRQAADLQNPPVPGRNYDRRHVVLTALVLLFASSTLYLLLRRAPATPLPPAGASTPALSLFWSRIFQPNRPTDIVLDDAAIGLYQELTGRPVTLSNYFDRAYLRSLTEAARAANLGEEAASSIALRRHSSYAGVSFLWKITRVFGASDQTAALRFARDYSFRELKADNVILLGNSRSNPWIESFESRLGLRWSLDPESGAYYPVDTRDSSRRYRPAPSAESREGFCAISLLANNARTGNVLVVTATGGSAVNAGADFLTDEASMAALRARLSAPSGSAFPDFEALIRIQSRAARPRDAAIVVCRPLTP